MFGFSHFFVHIVALLLLLTGYGFRIFYVHLFRMFSIVIISSRWFILSSDSLTFSQHHVFFGSFFSSSVSFPTVRLLFILCLYALAYWPSSPRLIQFDFSAGHFCKGLQLGALQNLHGQLSVFPVYLFFDLVPIFSILCTRSSFFIRRSFVVINASCILFFLFSFRVYFVSSVR